MFSKRQSIFIQNAEVDKRYLKNPSEDHIWDCEPMKKDHPTFLLRAFEYVNGDDASYFDCNTPPIILLLALNHLVS